jgi:transcriptional regulator with XRE-family HTH domain
MAAWTAKLRSERRLTLKQVESASGLSATHLSEIERGRTSPTIGALLRIARALEKDVSYFIEHEDIYHVQSGRLAATVGDHACSVGVGDTLRASLAIDHELRAENGAAVEFILVSTRGLEDNR